MQHVVRYRPVAEHAHRLAEVYPRHKAYLDAFQAEHGGILAIGTFDDPLVNGSMAIFASREAAARFVSADPFVVEGLAVPDEVRDWDPHLY